jgi:hypothetical protein
MVPNLFAIDNERLVDVLFSMVVLSFFIERALALVFDSRGSPTSFRGGD